MIKKLSILLFSLVFILAACGTSEDNKETTKGNLYEEIKEKGVLTVGTEGTYPPFTFHDENDQLTGFDVEVITEVAKRLGLEVEFKETQWDSMFEGLNSKRFDLIANQVGIRPDRLENYDFSIPYTKSSAVVVVPKNNNDIQSFEDIKGKRSAQSLTSNYADMAREYGAEIVGVEGLAQAVELLKQGRVDLTINDSLAVLEYLKQQPDADIKIAVQSDDVAESGFAFRKGNKELVDAINEQLQAMIDDGTLAKISEKWFGEDVSK